MFLSILAGIAALAATVAVIIAVLALRNRIKSKSVGVKKSFRTVDSVGVKSSLGKSLPRHVVPRAQHGTTARPVSNPSDNLRSRFVAVGVLAAGVFGSLAVKLWTMQILSGSKYRNEAEQNQFTTVYTPAPRGTICDENGLALVKNRSSLTVLADPDVSSDNDVLLRLSAVLGVPRNVVRNRVQDSSSGAQSQRIVASDVRMRDIAFISEHSDAFPGVTVQTRTVRDYPYGALAAHLMGYTGAVSEDELANVPAGREIKMGDEVGKSGIEAQYDNLLAGDHGERKVVADVNGNVVEVVSESQPSKGSDIRLTIKGPVQYVCDRELAASIAPSGDLGSGTGTAGAIVMMDVETGGIVAMASYPTFAPETFVGGISQDAWELYTTEDAHDPLTNRAIAGQYPAASTYKAFTSLAALKYGYANKKTTWDCTGSWDGWHTGQPQHCWDLSGHGTMTLHSGIVNSCDVVFYDIAQKFFDNSEKIGPTALQDFVKQFRFDEQTGIDLPGELQGRVPTPEWKAEYFRDQPEAASWQGGDMTNMAIGQGYVLTTPIELAVAYGGVATGKLMKPHVLKEVRNAAGEVVYSVEPEVVAEPDVDPDDLAMVREALRGVATENEGISNQLENYQDLKLALKTGTAEVAGKTDFAWTAMYAPSDKPKYVVTCIVEEGGGGSDVATPLCAKAMDAVFKYDKGKLDKMGVVSASSGHVATGYETGSSSSRTD